MSAQDVTNGGLGDGDALRDLSVGQSSLAKFADIRDHLRRNSSSASPPQILTMSDCFQMIWSHARWDAT